MNQREDPDELERKIAQASRLANRVSDQTTVGRLLAWVEELRKKLQQLREQRHVAKSESGRGSFGKRPAARPDEM